MPHGSRVLDPFLAAIPPVRTNTATIPSFACSIPYKEIGCQSGFATANLTKMELRPPISGIFLLPVLVIPADPRSLRNFSEGRTAPTSAPKSIEDVSQSVRPYTLKPSIVKRPVLRKSP